MEKINGIIKDGAVYVESRGHSENCDLRKSCMLDEERLDANYCQIFVLGSGENFRYSPSLTERLNNPRPPKRQRK